MRCRKNQAAPSRISCRQCAEASKEENAKLRERKQEMKRKGICINCFKESAAPNCIRCIACLQKDKESKRRRNVKKKADSGNDNNTQG